MLRIIEKPKGCLKVLSLLAEEEYVCVTDIISGWEMSQSSAYSSLKHLLGLGLISRADPLGRSGKRKKYVPTVSGRKLLKPLNAFFKSARYVLGKEDISSLLELPAESLESIVQFHKKGYVSLTDMLAEGVCKGTAKSILDALHEICLIKMAGARAGKSRRKKHSLTKRGECLAQILELVDETLDKMLHMKAPQT